MLSYTQIRRRRVDSISCHGYVWWCKNCG